MGEEWRRRAGPLVRATLPDDQDLDVVVVARTRTGDGLWWFECEALQDRREVDDGAQAAAPHPARWPGGGGWEVVELVGFFSVIRRRGNKRAAAG